MPNYRRVFIPGGTYFFGVNTRGRKPILTSEEGRAALRRAWRKTRKAHPFETVALVVLPDHMHCIWTLPEDDCDYDGRWSAIKALFSRRYRDLAGAGVRCTRRDGDAGIWQRRFWEHAIRDEDDFARHMDYVHYNPVNHGLVESVSKWPWSSFHRCKREGMYPDGWGDEPEEWMLDLGTSGE